MEAANPSDLLQVKVFSPFKVFYQGDAVSVSAANKTGPFDVLVGHASFFSILTAGEIAIDTGKDKQIIPLQTGVIRVANNRVTVFTNV